MYLHLVIFHHQILRDLWKGHGDIRRHPAAVDGPALTPIFTSERMVETPLKQWDKHMEKHLSTDAGFCNHPQCDSLHMTLDCQNLGDMFHDLLCTRIPSHGSMLQRDASQFQGVVIFTHSTWKLPNSILTNTNSEIDWLPTEAPHVG